MNRKLAINVSAQKLMALMFSAFLLIVCSCDLESPVDGSGGGDYESIGDSEPGAVGGGSGQIEPGTITSGEWNDLDNWVFWDTLLTYEAVVSLTAYWDFYPNHRVSVLALDSNNIPVNNIEIQLKRNNDLVWTARTDNFGKAELWISLFNGQNGIDLSQYSLSALDGTSSLSSIMLFEDQVNEMRIADPPAVPNHVEIAFVVDATGSMSDELEYLKVELNDVIDSVYTVNPGVDLYTGAVFYRDVGDAYVTRVSNFTATASTTLEFIANQSASGGGDYPEAVHTALDMALNQLQWSEQAKARVLFLLLDAPPHYRNAVVDQLHEQMADAAAKGIKIIPITASGINHETEFLMRFFAMSTNGTYVFITGHSGIGLEHLEPTVGQYEVEYLNHLLVRLINKYME